MDEKTSGASVMEKVVCSCGGVAHGEARMSANARLVDPNGVEWQITMREGVDLSMFQKMASVLPYVSKELLTAGWRNPGLLYVPPTPEQEKGEPEVAPAPTARPPTPEGTECIQVTHVSKHQTDDGSQLYLRIYGGRFHKFGVRCWSEIAADLVPFGILMDDLQLGAKVAVVDRNIKAFYTRTDEGKVNKVVGIVSG